MAADGGASRTIDDDWLSADQIAALAGGRVKPNTVRMWWRKGLLEFTTFPELGTKSNKRSQRGAVVEFLSRKIGAAATTPPAAPQLNPGFDTPRGPRVADLQDTLASLKASTDAAIEALIVEAEQNASVTAAHAEVSLAQARLEQARAEADARRVDMLRHLQTVLRGYDLALATYVQPETVQGLLP